VRFGAPAHRVADHFASHGRVIGGRLDWPSNMRHLASLFLIVVVLAACAAPAPTRALDAELVAPGKLTVCLSLLGSLAAAQDDKGALSGYNVDFANKLADQLQLAPDLVVTPFVELIDRVEAHGCDVSVSSQNITAGRLARIDLVPYTRASQRVLVAKDNPAGVNDLGGLCGLMVSTTEGSIFADMVEGTGDFDGRGLSQACLASGRLPIEVHKFSDQQAAVQALLDGEVAAHLGNPNFVYDYPDKLSQSPATLPASRQGIGVAKDHPQLRAGIESALAALIADGTYHDILLSYLEDERFVQAGSILPPASGSPGASASPN
jgi:polar amino acid transport system substrate-binding protein